jgi:hypothetical protein
MYSWHDELCLFYFNWCADQLAFSVGVIIRLVIRLVFIQNFPITYNGVFPGITREKPR